MRKMVLLGFAAALAISACASAEDVESAGSDGDDASLSVETTVSPTDSSLPVEGETPTESIPEDPNADLNSDVVSSGLPEPGDTPPPADDGNSVVLGEGAPPMEDGDSVVIGDGIPEPALTAMTLLASQLGVSIDTVDWVSYQNVTWPDGSIGCPQKGMSYTQALVSGYVIVLEVEGRAYRYHGAAGSDPFLCLTPTDPLPPGVGGDT